MLGPFCFQKPFFFSILKRRYYGPNFLNILINISAILNKLAEFHNFIIAMETGPIGRFIMVSSRYSLPTDRELSAKNRIFSKLDYPVNKYKSRKDCSARFEDKNGSTVQSFICT